MHLKGSCHCRKIRFELEAPHPVPFNRCYCSICRKTAGAGGFAINLGGLADSLRVEGREHISIYQAAVLNDAGEETAVSPLRRHFCRHCGSPLWAWDDRWPELVHPHASAIDTPLPKPPELVHLMLASKADWVSVERGPNDRTYDHYPEESLADWHRRLDLES